jgi:transcriptional regulator with XRE-family HTH domain
VKAEGSGDSVIAQRLNRLFATVHPAGRGPYLLREVADAINDEAGENVISPAYLSMLRSGQRTEPSHSRLAAIARFFGVDVDYFSDDSAADATDQQIEFLSAMRDTGVRTVALRAQGLSEASLAAVRAVIENARRLEGLQDDGPGGSRTLTRLAPHSREASGGESSQAIVTPSGFRFTVVIASRAAVIPPPAQPSALSPRRGDGTCIPTRSAADA